MRFPRLIHRHNGCVALLLFRFGHRQLELVYCPRGEFIEPHVHQHVDSTLIILGGAMNGCIGLHCGRTGWWDFGRRFKIPAGTVHNAYISGRFCIFLNYEKWDGKPSSAAIDFVAP